MNLKTRFCGFKLTESTIELLALWSVRIGVEKSRTVDMLIREGLASRIDKLDEAERKWFADAEIIAEARRAGQPGTSIVEAQRAEDEIDRLIAQRDADDAGLPVQDADSPAGKEGDR